MDPSKIDGAWTELLQYGGIGAVLLIVLVAGLLGLRVLGKNVFETLKRKDEEIARINEQRVEAATVAVEAITTTSNKIDQLLETNKTMVNLLERLVNRRSD